MKTFLLFGAVVAVVHGACPNACSGHGTCDAQDQCLCFLEVDGNSMFLGADCSQFTCPRGVSWKEPAKKLKTQNRCRVQRLWYMRSFNWRMHIPESLHSASVLCFE